MTATTLRPATTPAQKLPKETHEQDREAKLVDKEQIDSSEPELRSSARVSAADRHIGNRIRERRVMLGLSQQQLAQMIGVTYQQAHKYERGLSRISAGRLYEIGQVLSVPTSWFFEGLAAETHHSEMTQRQRMCLELARNFAAIDNEKHQKALSQMARSFAAQSEIGVEHGFPSPWNEQAGESSEETIQNQGQPEPEVNSETELAAVVDRFTQMLSRAEQTLDEQIERLRRQRKVA